MITTSTWCVKGKKKVIQFFKNWQLSPFVYQANVKFIVYLPVSKRRSCGPSNAETMLAFRSEQRRKIVPWSVQKKSWGEPKQQASITYTIKEWGRNKKITIWNAAEKIETHSENKKHEIATKEWGNHVSHCWISVKKRNFSVRIYYNRDTKG